MSRIATSSIHETGYSSISKNQTLIYKLQEQFATGKRINSAADDPAGAVQAAQLNASKSVNDQFSRNQNAAKALLGQSDALIGNIGDVMQSIQENLVAVGNGALSDSDKQQYATVLRSQIEQLRNLANTRDEAGRYVFAGYDENTLPFEAGSSGIIYNGDNGVRSLDVSSSVRLPISVSGNELFMNIKGGNGVIETNNVGTNAGTGAIDGGRVFDPATYDGSSFSITINSTVSGPVYSVTNTTTNTVVISGQPFIADQPISIPMTPTGAKAINVSISGTPAPGDTFLVKPASNTNIFDTVKTVLAQIDANTSGSLSSTGLADALRTAGTNVSQAYERTLLIRNRVGNDEQELERQVTLNGQQDTDVQARLSSVVDLDSVKAITDLTQAQTALQASQQVYSKIASRSLFDYL